MLVRAFLGLKLVPTILSSPIPTFEGGFLGGRTEGGLSEKLGVFFSQNIIVVKWGYFGAYVGQFKWKLLEQICGHF